jgi:hypothetical protein
MVYISMEAAAAVEPAQQQGPQERRTTLHHIRLRYIVSHAILHQNKDL